jgi:hypothetical protein
LKQHPLFQTDAETLSTLVAGTVNLLPVPDLINLIGFGTRFGIHPEPYKPYPLKQHPLFQTDAET